MTSAFDKRIVQVGIELGGELLLFEDLDIRATGAKYFSSTQNQCSIRISNLTKPHRNEILTKATPLNSPTHQRQPINITLDIGRESYGTFRLFEGAAWAFGASQPPDIGITLEGLTNNLQTAFITSTSFPAVTPLKLIAQKIADQNGLVLNYQVATEKSISNYHYTGPVAKQVQKLNEMGGVLAHVDNGTLTVCDTSPQAGDATIVPVNESTGMVGVPQPNMAGVIVKVLANSAINIGTKINVTSQINPSANGVYTVWNINFDVANRAEPFFYTLFCLNTVYDRGVL